MTLEEQLRDLGAAAIPREQRVTVILAADKIEQLQAALSDCVAVLLGEISGIAQKEAVIQQAVKALGR